MRLFAVKKAAPKGTTFLRNINLFRRINPAEKSGRKRLDHSAVFFANSTQSPSISTYRFSPSTV